MAVILRMNTVTEKRMRRWMRIFLSSFLFLLLSNANAECTYRNENVVSLSGTATVIFKEMGLLSGLKGISVFNPIPKDEYSGPVYPGGIFLSQNTMSEFKNKTVLFDESRELAKIFRSQNIKAVEIRTRNLSPTESIHRTLKEIIPLIKDCEKEIADVEKKRVSLETKIMNGLTQKKQMIFFLGELKQERLPEMIMSNDGVVKWLRTKEKISTYPSDLAYVNWSAKILLENTSDKTLLIGLNDPGREMTKTVKKAGNKINLVYPGSLVPGLSQLEAFAFLFEKI
jgi:hypothetical protein